MHWSKDEFYASGYLFKNDLYLTGKYGKYFWKGIAHGPWCIEVLNWISVIFDKHFIKRVKIGMVVLYKRAIQMIFSFNLFPFRKSKAQIFIWY